MSTFAIVKTSDAFGSWCCLCGDYLRHETVEQASRTAGRGCYRCRYDGETGRERHLETNFTIRPPDTLAPARLTPLAESQKYFAVHVEQCWRCKYNMPCFVADEICRGLVSAGIFAVDSARDL